MFGIVLPSFGLRKAGAGGRDRTYALLIKSQLLYLAELHLRNLVPPAGWVTCILQLKGLVLYPFELRRLAYFEAGAVFSGPLRLPEH